MKTFSNGDKPKAVIVSNMTDIFIFLDNSIKSFIYAGVDIHGLYCYIERIGSPTTLIISGQLFCHFGPSFSTNNYTATIHPVIADLHIRQKIICKYCGIIGHKDDACRICGPDFLPTSLIIKMNQFSTLRGDETTDPPREHNIQTPSAHFKSMTSHHKTSP